MPPPGPSSSTLWEELQRVPIKVATLQGRELVARHGAQRSGHALTGDDRLEIVDEVALVTIDEPGSSVNTLGTAAIEEFEQLLGDLEARTELRGVVLLSAKPDTFLAGADLKELGGLREPSEAERWVHRGQRLMARWRALPVPNVPAKAGAAR